MERHLRLVRLGPVAALALLTAGCLPSIADLDSGPLNSTFAVSDFFAPSGFMGDGEFFGDLVGTTNEGCKPRPLRARGNCYAFTYWPNNMDVDPWAGVFWVFPANSWGSTSGHAIDIAQFKQISFYAAVEGPTPYTVGQQPVPFSGQAGGINPKGQFVPQVDPKTGKTIRVGGKDYVDGVLTSGGWAIGDPSGVTSDMKQFHIPVTDFQKSAGCQDPANPDKAPNCKPTAAAQQMGLTPEQAHMMGLEEATFLIGAFAWALHYPNDQVPGCLPMVDPNTGMPIPDCRTGQHSSLFVDPHPVKIYLDDIVWDTQDPPPP
jgi:hypothetical protein